MANAGQRTRIILLIVCLLFIVGGSAILLYNTLTQPGQLHAEATATVATKTMETAQANLRSTAHVKATTQIRNKGFHFGRFFHFAIVAAASHLATKLYAQLFSRCSTHLLQPFKSAGQSPLGKGYRKLAVAVRAFINGAYHASMPQIGFFASCYDLSSNFSNFMQVQMTILKGDHGGNHLPFQ